MHLCLGVGLYTQEGVKSPVAEVISIYEPSNMGAENLTLSHLFGPQQINFLGDGNNSFSTCGKSCDSSRGEAVRGGVLQKNLVCMHDDCAAHMHKL